MEMANILVVDGNNLLFQMFYGMPARIVNSQGRPIQGTLGFVGALLKIIRRVKPTHAVVLFDGQCANSRALLDADYKANRQDYSLLPEEDTPFSQLPDIYAALDYLGIAHRETTDCEADDWIAGYAHTYGREHQITIVSQDSDFFQLITDTVHILRYRGDNSVFCDIAYLQGKYGILPNQYVDFKSLTGDAADNIRGAEKIGHKTAAALLQQFGTLDEALQRLPEIAKPSVRASLEHNQQRLKINQQLIRLTGSPQLPFSVEEMVWQYQGQTATQVLTAIGAR